MNAYDHRCHSRMIYIPQTKWYASMYIDVNMSRRNHDCARLKPSLLEIAGHCLRGPWELDKNSTFLKHQKNFDLLIPFSPPHRALHGHLGQLTSPCQPQKAQVSGCFKFMTFLCAHIGHFFIRILLFSLAAHKWLSLTFFSLCRAGFWQYAQEK